LSDKQISLNEIQVAKIGIAAVVNKTPNDFPTDRGFVLFLESISER
jgi:hypothetical protein